MGRRLLAFADRHAWVVTLCGVAFMFVVVAGSVTWNQRREDSNTRDQIRVVAEQNKAIEQAFIDGCKLAVSNGRDTNLEIMGFLREETPNRPATLAAITALENIILRKQDPNTTCVRSITKENP